MRADHIHTWSGHVSRLIPYDHLLLVFCVVKRLGWPCVKRLDACGFNALSAPVLYTAESVCEANRCEHVPSSSRSAQGGSSAAAVRKTFSASALHASAPTLDTRAERSWQLQRYAKHPGRPPGFFRYAKQPGRKIRVRGTVRSARPQIVTTGTQILKRRQIQL